MRTLDLGFKAHVQSGATTLATCWKLTRTDGVVLGFTDHDEAVTFGGTVFDPVSGMDGGERAAKLGASVDTTEVVGILDSEAITETDIVLGRYDGAVIETWRVNWRDPGQRMLQSRTTIGEIVREDGVFRAELRSGQEALNRVRGRIYGNLCDAEFGDGRCGLDASVAAYRATATVTELLDDQRCVVSGLDGYAAGWFTLGRAVWTSGAKAGLRDGIARHERGGDADVLGFTSRVGEWVAVGDTLAVTAGCDRSFATCRDRFGNSENFRGFPHVPGNDFVLHYPTADDDLSGGALVR